MRMFFFRKAETSQLLIGGSIFFVAVHLQSINVEVIFHFNFVSIHPYILWKRSGFEQILLRYRLESILVSVISHFFF